MKTSQLSPWMNVIKYVTKEPHALAIIFALTLMAIVLGLIPSSLETKIERIDAGLLDIKSEHRSMMDTTLTRYNALESKLDASTDITSKQNEIIIKLLRGSCLLQTQGDQDAALSFCNP